jgi:hypothetical protein
VDYKHPVWALAFMVAAIVLLSAILMIMDKCDQKPGHDGQPIENVK